VGKTRELSKASNADAPVDRFWLRFNPAATVVGQSDHAVLDGHPKKAKLLTTQDPDVGQERRAFRRNIALLGQS
jgi:hypothetical protein